MYLERGMKKQRKQAKSLRKNTHKKNNAMKRQKKTQLSIQLEEINPSRFKTERKFKRNRDRTKQYKQNMTLQNNERKFHQQVSRESLETSEQWDPKKAKSFLIKI